MRKNTKLFQSSWDFKQANTKEYTHCFHSYPAVMIPQVARRLINDYGKEGQLLLDPYCGSGTSLVEATLEGINAVGCDINPLARLIAKVKSTPLQMEVLNLQMEKLTNELRTEKFLPDTSNIIPNILNYKFWFSEETINHLAFIRSHIEKIKPAPIKDFFWVAFSETVRECSNTRNEEFKLYKMPYERLQDHKPNTLNTFISKLKRNKQGLKDYLKVRKEVKVDISEANTVKGETPKGKISYDLVVTSPPYGDSTTTVAYGQYSRLSSDWIGYRGVRELDRNSMGGSICNIILDKSPVKEQILEISDKDPKRSKQVAAFYYDLDNSIDTVSRITAKGGTICYVVGNRQVKGIVLSTDEFVKNAFTKRGFEHDNTISRNISRKRMPKLNSPNNIIGEKSETISQEHIVICHKY